MSRGLQPQTFAIPFGRGLNQKADPRALEVGALTVCKDAQFTELGGLQTRYPYASIGANIFGGGTLSDLRRIFENGTELLAFTKTGLYSWNVSRSAWVLKGTHLAVKTAEQTRFATTDDQIDCDRAELSGTVFYAWSGGVPGYGFVAAQDKTTGAVLMAPTALAGAGLRMRLTALETTVLLTFYDGVAGTYCLPLDPANPAANIGGVSTTVSPSGGGYYDIVKQPGANVAVFASRLAPATSYRVGTISAAGVVASSTKVRPAGTIAVACPPSGTQVQVVRDDGGPFGDLITISGFVDTAHINKDIQTGISVGSSADYIAVEYSSTIVGSAYRCHVFWGGGASTARNTLDTDGTLGAPVPFKITIYPASRAFDHEGRVYLWTVFQQTSTVFAGGFAPQFSYSLQNTYFLYRDDGFLVAKASGGAAGGIGSGGWLPGVSAIGGGEFAWCGINRQIIDLGGSGQTRTGYGARVPVDIVASFDSNEARRTARLGQTLYITGGEILQYDGTGLYEVGFHIYPNTMTLAETAGGNLAAGTYAVKQTWRWDNARGEVDRSTTATTGTVVIASAPGGIAVSAWLNLQITHKTNRPIAVETWRTTANPTSDAPFYLSTSKDPAAVTNPNRYLEVGTTVNGDTLNDELVDADISVKETSSENGAVLEPLAPPPATIILATAERLFLAGVAGDSDRVWYSKLRNDGEVAAFHDGLTINVPREGGSITAIGFRDGVLFVWREAAIYAFQGEGLNNLGEGQNYGPARVISRDVGAVSMEAVTDSDRGFIFKSSKGWHATAGGAPEYIGAPIMDYDSDTVVAVHALEGKHEIRCLTTSRMLVLDTAANQWAEWTIADGLHAAIWNGTYHYLATASVKAEQTTYAALTYGMDIETAWIPLGQVQGFGRVWKVLVLGEYRSAHYLRVALYKNYATAAFQTKNWTVTPTTAGGPLQVKHGPSVQEMQSIKIRLTAIDLFTPEGGGAQTVITPTGEALKLTSLALELGVEQHLMRLPTAQTQ